MKQQDEHLLRPPAERNTALHQPEDERPSFQTQTTSTTSSSAVTRAEEVPPLLQPPPPPRMIKLYHHVWLVILIVVGMALRNSNFLAAGSSFWSWCRKSTGKAKPEFKASSSTNVASFEYQHQQQQHDQQQQQQQHRDPCLIFYHIPKVGGTTVQQFLKIMAKNKLDWTVLEWNSSDPRQMDRHRHQHQEQEQERTTTTTHRNNNENKKQQNINNNNNDDDDLSYYRDRKIHMGHLTPRFEEWTNTQACYKLIVFREPVDRVISAFYYHGHNTSEWSQCLARNATAPPKANNNKNKNNTHQITTHNSTTNTNTTSTGTSRTGGKNYCSYWYQYQNDVVRLLANRSKAWTSFQEEKYLQPPLPPKSSSSSQNVETDGERQSWFHDAQKTIEAMDFVCILTSTTTTTTTGEQQQGGSTLYPCLEQVKHILLTEQLQSSSSPKHLNHGGRGTTNHHYSTTASSSRTINNNHNHIFQNNNNNKPRHNNKPPSNWLSSASTPPSIPESSWWSAVVSDAVWERIQSSYSQITSITTENLLWDPLRQWWKHLRRRRRRRKHPRSETEFLPQLNHNPNRPKTMNATLRNEIAQANDLDLQLYQWVVQELCQQQPYSTTCSYHKNR